MQSMITLLARFEMTKGKELQAMAAFQTMAKAMKDNEPGCLMFAVTRGQVNAQEVYLYEIYKDQASLDAHRKTDHLQTFRKASEECLDRGAFNVEILDEVGGFIREPVAEMASQM